MYGRALLLTVAVGALGPASNARADDVARVPPATAPIAPSPSKPTAAAVPDAREPREAHDSHDPYRDPYQLPDAPRALSLPELTHPGIEWTTTTAIGSLVVGGHNAPEILERIGVEAALGPRRWYLGLAYEAGYGAPAMDPGPARLLGGNLELYGRTVWATRTGLSFGGGVGFLVPVATFASSSEGSDAAIAAISLQPWDYAFFRTGVLTARPFVDMRTLFGRFVVQVRQSFDFSADLTDITQRRDVSAAITVYLGGLASRLIGLGLETTEYYLVDADVPDNQRAKVVVAPNVRFLTPGIQPSLGAFVGVGTPLASNADAVWGLRFGLTFIWDPSRPFFTALQLFQ
jgi:hypothetical protein